jgi:hypothetical protein
MFEKAEILFVCIVNTGLAWMAEGAMRAKLPQAGLVAANLQGASLIGASLIGASLHGASLMRANLIGASLMRANLIGAELNGTNLEGADLEGAYYDANTKWPEGFDPKAAGAEFSVPSIGWPYWFRASPKVLEGSTTPVGVGGGS